MIRFEKRARGERGRERGRESDLSAMPLQPSFQIRAAPSLENVTFSRSRQGGDGGSRKGGVGWGWWKTNVEVGEGQRGDCRFSEARKTGGSSRGGKRERERRDAGFHSVM